MYIYIYVKIYVYIYIYMYKLDILINGGIYYMEISLPIRTGETTLYSLLCSLGTQTTSKPSNFWSFHLRINGRVIRFS